MLRLALIASGVFMFCSNSSAQFTSFCFGGVDAGPCPCANNGTGFDGCSNTTGAGAILAPQSGSQVIANANLEFEATGLPPNFGQAGVLFTGLAANNIVPGLVVSDGLLCVGGGPRLQVGLSQVPGIWSTKFSLDGINLFTEAEGLMGPNFFVPGGVYSFQLWYRDQQPVFTGLCASPLGGSNLSNAIQMPLF